MKRKDTIVCKTVVCAKFVLINLVQIQEIQYNQQQKLRTKIWFKLYLMTYF